jgi:hypothetical protein
MCGEVLSVLTARRGISLPNEKESEKRAEKLLAQNIARTARTDRLAKRGVNLPVITPPLRGVAVMAATRRSASLKVS